MIRLLVTAISGNVSTGILRSLQTSSYTLLGCDVGEYPAGMDLVEDWFQVPYAKEDDYIGYLLRESIQRNIDAILPVNEAEILKLNDYRCIFENAGIKLILNNPFIVETCSNKYVCMKELSKIGVSVPKSFRPREMPKEHGDYILKPCFGCGSKFLKRIATSAQAIEEEINYGDSLVAQEYLPATDGEYTMGVFSDGEETRCIVFRRKLTHGYSSFVELVDNKAMEEVGQIVAKEWGLQGSINLQMRIKNGTPYVFEINPRLSGTTHFRAMLGFNDALWWCEKSFGHIVPKYKQNYKKAIGLRETTEKFIITEFK